MHIVAGRVRHGASDRVHAASKAIGASPSAALPPHPRAVPRGRLRLTRTMSVCTRRASPGSPAVETPLLSPTRTDRVKRSNTPRRATSRPGPQPDCDCSCPIAARRSSSTCAPSRSGVVAYRHGLHLMAHCMLDAPAVNPRPEAIARTRGPGSDHSSALRRHYRLGDGDSHGAASDRLARARSTPVSRHDRPKLATSTEVVRTDEGSPGPPVDAQQIDQSTNTA